MHKKYTFVKRTGEFYVLRVIIPKCGRRPPTQKGVRCKRCSAPFLRKTEREFYVMRVKIPKRGRSPPAQKRVGRKKIF